MLRTWTTAVDGQTWRDITPGITRPGIDVPVRTTASGFLSGEVTIEGIKKPLNFIIDTGATVSVLSERAAELDDAIDFIQEDRMRVFGAAGIAENVKIALLPKVVLGSLHARKDQRGGARPRTNQRDGGVPAKRHPRRKFPPALSRDLRFSARDRALRAARCAPACR